jgi:hypothetical protein
MVAGLRLARLIGRSSSAAAALHRAVLSGQITLYGLAAMAFMAEQKRRKSRKAGEAQSLSRKPTGQADSQRSQ